MEVININEFLAIAVVGALLSVVFEVIGKKFPTNPNKTKALVILLSLIVGGFYVWIRSTPYFMTFITVLGAASTVYSLFFNKKSE